MMGMSPRESIHRASFAGSRALSRGPLAVPACTATLNETPASGGDCAQDPSVVGCVGDSKGYSCSGVVRPDQRNAALSCSAGATGSAGSTLYCCVDVAFASNTCSADVTIVGCGGTALGFSCQGNVRPDQTDSSLVCSQGSRGSAGETLYCCAPFTASASTCAQDTSVQGCGGSAIGFSCTGSIRPETVNGALGVHGGRRRRRGHPLLLRHRRAPRGNDDGHVRGRGERRLRVAGDRLLVRRGRHAAAGRPVSQLRNRDRRRAAVSSRIAAITPRRRRAPACKTRPSPGARRTLSGTRAPARRRPSSRAHRSRASVRRRTTARWTTAARTGRRPPAMCMPDASVTGCPGIATGYSCTGNASPETNSTLLCGMAMTGAGGTMTFCCTPNWPVPRLARSAFHPAPGLKSGRSGHDAKPAGGGLR